MCFGIEAGILGPLLASGLGVAGQMIQQNEAQQQAQRQAEARNEELRRTLLKNDTLAQEGRDTFSKRVTDADRAKVDQQQQKAKTQRAEELNKSVEATPDMQKEQGAEISGTAPAVVGNDLAKRMGAALDENKAAANKLSALGSYGDSWLKQGFLDTQAGRNVGTTTNKAAGNSAILPYAQDFAEYKATRPISPLGGILSGFGNMIGSWAGSQSNTIVPRKTYTTPFIG